MLPLNPEPLTARQQAIALIAALVASGDLPRLRTALADGLAAGLTVSEAKEELVQLYAYCGFPRSLGALGILMRLAEEHQAQGRPDAPGREASPIDSTAPRYERGKQVLEQLTGKPELAPTGVNAFVPAIDRFLKEHLFADIFERDVLTYQERELATIAALVSLGGVEPMLQAHLGMGMHVGLTEPQLQQLFRVVQPAVGPEKVAAGRELLAQASAPNEKP